MPHKLLSFICAAGLAFPVAAGEFESKQKLALQPVYEGLTLAFEPVEVPKGLRKIMLSVSGPRNYQATVTSKKRLPKIQLDDFGKVFDGRFRFEVTGTTGEKIEVNSPIDENGRTNGSFGQRQLSARFGGSFVVSKGEIVIFKDEKEKEN